MSLPPFPGSRVLLNVGLSLLALSPSVVCGQGTDLRVREAYFRAVADHFQVPLEEVAVVGDWDLAPDEVPVVLFLSKSAGVSPDALIAMRRGGKLWREVATRFGLSGRSFHLPLPEGEPLGSLARAYNEFRGHPPGDWPQIELEDFEIIALVNLRVLSEQVGVPPLQVLQSHAEAGSFLAAFAILRGHGLQG